MCQKTRKKEKVRINNNNNNNNSKHVKKRLRDTNDKKRLSYKKANKRPCCMSNKDQKQRKLLFVFVCVCMIEILCLFKGNVNEYNHHPKTGKQQTI